MVNNMNYGQQCNRGQMMPRVPEGCDTCNNMHVHDKQDGCMTCGTIRVPENYENCNCKTKIKDQMMGMPLAMAYVPWQTLECTYEPVQALMAGTIFPELDKPFYGRRGMR